MARSPCFTLVLCLVLGACGPTLPTSADDRELSDEPVGTSVNAVSACYCAAPFTCGHSASPSYMYPAAHAAMLNAGVSDAALIQTFGDAPASVGTHCPEPGASYSAATDFVPGSSPCGRVHALRMQGFAAWYRIPPTFSYHIHAVYAGTPSLKSSLKDQLASFAQGRNGLVGNAVDTVCPISQAERDAVARVRAGGSGCSCSGSGTQTQACGTCGTQSRSCNGCGWGNWGACTGPDPEGGNQVCDSGAQGVCAAARTRCVAGALACQSVVAPSPEVCDGLDNDCNGEADEGHPPVGANRPPFAASITDASYPRTLKRGERATVWVEFRNEGSTAWTHDNLWLSARSPDSQLYAADSWPAFDVAATLATPVQPGEVGRFSFDIVVAAAATGELAETFQLQQPDGQWVGCPQADLTPLIRVMREGELLATVDAGSSTAGGDATGEGGCSSAGGLGLVSLSMLALRLTRRRQGAAR